MKYQYIRERVEDTVVAAADHVCLSIPDVNFMCHITRLFLYAPLVIEPVMPGNRTSDTLLVGCFAGASTSPSNNKLNPVILSNPATLYGPEQENTAGRT